MEMETPGPVAMKPDAPAFAAERERETPAPAAMQPRVPAVSMEVETPVPAAVHPDDPNVAAETNTPAPAAVAAETETPAHDEVQLDGSAETSINVDTDADIAQFVAENEAKPSSRPNKAKAEEVMVVNKRIHEGLKCPFSVFYVPANGSCQVFVVIESLKHRDPALLSKCASGTDEQRVLQLCHQVAKHLLQDAHRDMACPTRWRDVYSCTASLLDVIRGRGDSTTESASSGATTPIRRVPKGWGSLPDDYLQMRANLKALPEDADCRDHQAWACITFVIQGIWTSGEEMQRSEFNYRLMDLSYGNDMTLTALSSMLNKRMLNRRSQDTDELMTAGRVNHAPCGSLLTCRFLGWSLSSGYSPKSCILFKHRNRDAFPGFLRRDQHVGSLSACLRVGLHML
eukprot:5005447-Pleurochrysis_carterae.AAC.1